MHPDAKRENLLRENAGESKSIDVTVRICVSCKAALKHDALLFRPVAGLMGSLTLQALEQESGCVFRVSRVAVVAVGATNKFFFSTNAAIDTLVQWCLVRDSLSTGLCTLEKSSAFRKACRFVFDNSTWEDIAVKTKTSPSQLTCEQWREALAPILEEINGTQDLRAKRQAAEDRVEQRKREEAERRRKEQIKKDAEKPLREIAGMFKEKKGLFDRFMDFLLGDDNQEPAATGKLSVVRCEERTPLEWDMDLDDDAIKHAQERKAFQDEETRHERERMLVEEVVQQLEPLSPAITMHSFNQTRLVEFVVSLCSKCPCRCCSCRAQGCPLCSCRCNAYALLDKKQTLTDQTLSHAHFPSFNCHRISCLLNRPCCSCMCGTRCGCDTNCFALKHALLDLLVDCTAAGTLPPISVRFDALSSEKGKHYYKVLPARSVLKPVSGKYVDQASFVVSQRNEKRTQRERSQKGCSQKGCSQQGVEGLPKEARESIRFWEQEVRSEFSVPDSVRKIYGFQPIAGMTFYDMTAETDMLFSRIALEEKTLEEKRCTLRKRNAKRNAKERSSFETTTVPFWRGVQAIASVETTDPRVLCAETLHELSVEMARGVPFKGPWCYPGLTSSSTKSALMERLEESCEQRARDVVGRIARRPLCVQDSSAAEAVSKEAEREEAQDVLFDKRLHLLDACPEDAFIIVDLRGIKDPSHRYPFRRECDGLVFDIQLTLDPLYLIQKRIASFFLPSFLLS